ncbi:MAG: tyrosine-type recombinase/integrase [Gammaproteobacteria bacterium]|nr:tyrosine-type recombinase/integrase [Gammaproteobacteria bacterium]
MVRKRNKVWHIDFQFNGRRIRQSAQTTVKKEAEKLEHKLRTQLYSQAVMGDQPRRSWQEAVIRYSREAQSKRTWKDIQRHLIYFDTKLGQLYLDQINNDVIEAIIDEKLSEGVTGATVNRYTTTLKTVLRKAYLQYEWIQRVPAIRSLPESKGRLRWLTTQEYERLIAVLPEHAALVVRFAVHTGLRSANIFKLSWDQIDLERKVAWIHADQHKNGRARSVPLNSEAMAVLEAINQGPHHIKAVFTYQGHPISTIRTTLKNACESLGLEEVTFHTFRHTYASWLVQQEVPLRTIQELGGWCSVDMVQRYAHLAGDDLQAYQERLVGRHKTVTNPLTGTRNNIH